MVGGYKITKGNIRGEGKVWLKTPERILAECKPGGQRSYGGRWQMRKLLQVQGTEKEDGAFVVNCLQKVPARIGVSSSHPLNFGVLRDSRHSHLLCSLSDSP